MTNLRLQLGLLKTTRAFFRAAVPGFALCVTAFSAAAQTKQTPATSCVPGTQQVLRAETATGTEAGQSFLDNQNTNAGRENFSTDPLSQKPGSARSIKKWRKSLETAARRGDRRAELNLAVASLAGWGAPSNAGAALYWFRAAADQGYPPALYDLGIVHMKGCGVRQDYAEAFLFFEKGALGGDSAAQVNLGYLYDQGLGVARDQSMAAFWYRKGAETGTAAAQYNLADLYLRGEGVAQDDAAAFQWFQRAALQGHARARVMLGSLYAAGRGVSKDFIAAYMWLVASEMEGDAQCRELLTWIEAHLNPAQLAEARERANSLGHSRTLHNETALLY
jgi:TPR repeat protein